VVVTDGLNAAGRLLHRAEGRVLRLPQRQATGWKAKPLANALLEDAGVAIIGGPDFGVLGEGYVRLSYANSTENILKALDRMGEFLASRRTAG
jgi:aspartate aminotransferase